MKISAANALTSALEMYLPDDKSLGEIPLFICSVQAGFPSPAEDYIDQKLDLHQLLIRNASATIFVRAEGESMEGAGIGNGDLLIVDRSVTVRNGHIAICHLNGGFTVKRLNILADGRIELLAANPKMKPIVVRDLEELRVMGVVSYAIKKLL